MRGRWAVLIEDVRLTFPDLELMYSANWDHFKEVTFWDLVDVVGMTAYFELTARPDPTSADLVARWQTIHAELGDFARRLGRPLVITEIGYPSIDGAAMWPWDETRTSRIDLEEQRLAYESFVRVWSDTSFLRGVYWWNWFGFGGAADTSYTPRNKPAQEIIRRWYTVPR